MSLTSTGVSGKRGGMGRVVNSLARDRWDIASALLLAAAFLLMAATFRDYGYSWDEAAYNVLYGKLVLKFLSTLGGDREALNAYNLYLYGGAYDATREFVVGLLSFNPKYVRHFCNATVGLACLAGTWRTARLAFGSRAGFFALLLLAVTPPFWGHIFINAKDIPFAAGYVWSVFWLLRLDREMDSARARTVVPLSVVLGLTLGVRIGGILLLMYLALLTARHLIFGEAGSRVRVAAVFLVVTASAWIVMMGFWPAAMLSPVSAPYEAFVAVNKFSWEDSVLFNGEYVLSHQLPWTYLPVTLGVGLPEAVVAAALAGAGYCAWRATSTLRAGRAGEAAGLGLLLLAGLFPPLWAIVMKAKLYDNMRHFLFVVPILCCMAGGALSAAIGALAGESLKYAVVAGIGLGAALLHPVIVMAGLHPYEYVYVNSLGGGIPGGEKRFETDYWLTSYGEAFGIVKEHADRVANVVNVPLGRVRFTVVALGNDDVIAEELPWYFELLPAELSIPPDYVIVTSRWNEEWVLPEYPLIGTVGRMGMTFAKVYASPAIIGMYEGRIKYGER